MGAQKFEDLVAWRLAHELKCEVLAFIRTGPAAADFRFRDDIRGSSASAPANIAEGFGRFRPLQFAHFLGIARASLAETHNHLIDARDRGYLDVRTAGRLINLARAASRVTTNLLRAKLRQAEEQRRHPHGRPARVPPTPLPAAPATTKRKRQS